MIEIMIDLQGGAKAPLYEKIYESIKKEIIDGKILKGEKLPSTRLFAKNLMVSRSTVEIAYDQLLAEGYIKSEPCRGFFACDVTELYQLEKCNSSASPAEEKMTTEDWKVDFSPYAIDTDNFPYNIWRKINKNLLLDGREELLLSGEKQGEYQLRKAIAAYLHQARGVNCKAEDMIIGAGNEYLEILLTQILGTGKSMLIENPGYPQAYRTFLNMGYHLKSVDATVGMTLATLREQNPQLLYIMPSHQFPTGHVMPLGQRIELLKWAAEKEGRFLIEDDHDSEYRYRGKPIPSLQSIDRYGKVIYLGTFSKSVAPSLRISYMVLPPELMKLYHEKCGFYANTVPRIQQEVLREFIEKGHFERHLNKMRGIYRSKHDFLLGELKQCNWVRKISGDHAGLHLLVQADSRMSEEKICQLAKEQGVKISGISQYHFDTSKSDSLQYPVLLLGYGRLSEAQIKEGIQILTEILESKNEFNY